jgi:DNA-binding transcriptional ArsR family regulator
MPIRRISSTQLFAALGDETRLGLVARLCTRGGPLSITELTADSGVTRQGITKHLSVMERSGLARSTRCRDRAERKRMLSICLLIFPEANESRMPQMSVWCPLQKFEFADQQWFLPSALVHLFSGQSLTPAAAPRFRQIREGALRDFQILELPKQLLAERWGESISRARRIHELVALVVSEDQSIEILSSRGVASNDEFLSLVDPHLLPGSGP